MKPASRKFRFVPMRFAIVLLGFTMAALFPSRLQGGGVVTNCTEANLRAVVAGGGTVRFACNGTIALSSPITITNGTVLDASGRSVTLSGQNLTLVFNVNAGATLSLRYLTLRNGLAAGYRDSTFGIVWPGAGGSIANTGTVSAVNCVFSNNSARGFSSVVPSSGYGGAIFNAGAFTATNCVCNRSPAEGRD